MRSVRQRKIDTICCHLYVESKPNKRTKTELMGIEKRLVDARGGGLRVGKIGEGSEKVQTSSYKISPMGCSV